MKCLKCNHTIPEDSEFCQYCGKLILKSDESHITKETTKNSEIKNEHSVQTAQTSPENNIDSSNNKAKEDNKQLKSLADEYANYTLKTFRANKEEQPNFENEEDFGLTPSKPIYTLAIDLVDGQKAYLNRLYTENGDKITWYRTKSFSSPKINGSIDEYETYLPNGELYKKIYINMYGAEKSQSFPQGFIDKKSAQKKRKELNGNKTKYCNRCGSIIDKDTKQCTGCKKQYFKVIKFNKYQTTVISLSIITIILSLISTSFFINNKKLLNQNNIMQTQINNLNESNNRYRITTTDLSKTITDLSKSNSDKESTITELKKENLKIKYSLNFYEKYAAIVPNDGTKKYHTYSCKDLDTSSFWIYNYSAAIQEGYYPCPNCH